MAFEESNGMVVMERREGANKVYNTIALSLAGVFPLVWVVSDCYLHVWYYVISIV